MIGPVDSFPMPTNKPKDTTDVTRLGPMQVMQSAAGYYIGKWCYSWNGELWFPEPYSRNSQYMSKSEAEIELQYIHKLEDEDR